MARYTGPKVRLSRKFGEDIFGNTTKRMQGRNQNVRRRKTSEYGIMLAEKQKAKYTYGVLEKQFRNLFDKAAKSSGITGDHKHITVDGRVVNIASFSVKPGQIVAVREKSKSLEVIADALAGFNHSKYPWIEWDESTKSGKLLHKPERADIPENIKEQLIVELYSKN